MPLPGLGLPTFAAASVISTFFATALSLPFDMMKTRLQNMQPDPKTGAVPYNGVFHCGYRIFSEEGPLRFWRGYPAYFFRCCPHGLIILISQEYIKKAYNRAFSLE
eukprot:SAG31_NODE_3660_length_4013_cov_3.345938_2_plen_106_part_00